MQKVKSSSLLIRTSAGIRVARKRDVIRVPGVRVADDLVERNFRPASPDVSWVADLTYRWTWKGWLCLATVQDAYSRMIVGWSMADHTRADLVVRRAQHGHQPASVDTKTRPASDSARVSVLQHRRTLDQRVCVPCGAVGVVAV